MGREVRVKTRGDLLLPNGRKGVTAWDIAALNAIKEGLEKLYSWGTEVQVNLKGDFLPVKDYSVLSAWHTAAEDVFTQGRNILSVNIQSLAVFTVM